MKPCVYDDDVVDRWDMTDAGQLKHRETGLCLDHEHSAIKKFVYVTECNDESKWQTWTIEH
jgi:hypothetical protein